MGHVGSTIQPIRAPPLPDDTVFVSTSPFANGVDNGPGLRPSPAGDQFDKTYRNGGIQNASYCPPPHRRCDRRGRSHLHGRGRARPKRHAEHSSGRFTSGLQCGGIDPQSRPDRAVLPHSATAGASPAPPGPGDGQLDESQESAPVHGPPQSRSSRTGSGRRDEAASVAVGCRLQRLVPGTDVGHFRADGCGGGPHRPADGAAPVGGGVAR